MQGVEPLGPAAAGQTQGGKSVRATPADTGARRVEVRPAGEVRWATQAKVQKEAGSVEEDPGGPAQGQARRREGLGLGHQVVRFG